MKPVKQGVMCKRAQGKSKFGRDNWKDRFFVLTPQELSYWEGFGGPSHPGAKLKGTLDLSKVVVVEAVPDEAFKPQRKNTIQITYDEATLYTQAQTPEEREEWLAEIRRQVKGNDGLLPKYHSGVFTDTKWSCCGTTRRSIGCQDSFDYSVLGGVMKRSVSDALPPTPALLAGAGDAAGSPPRQASVGSHPSGTGTVGASPAAAVASPAAPIGHGLVPTGDEFEVQVMYPYQALEPTDLPLSQGERLVIMDQREEHWWQARNAEGRVGMIPSNYVRKVGLESEP